MANAVLIQHECAGREWMGVNGEILCNAGHSDDPFIAVGVFRVARIDYAVVDLILQGLERSWLDLIAYKDAQGFSMVKRLALAPEMVFKLVPLLQFCNVGDWLLGVIRIGRQQLGDVATFRASICSGGAPGFGRGGMPPPKRATK